MDENEHLFRHEAGRLVSALTRIFGVHNLALAEDVVQDVFCGALEVWRVRGMPDNPSAWLMTAARNRTLDIIHRERTATRFAPELGRLIESEWTLAPIVDEILEDDAIQDSLLRMSEKQRIEGTVATRILFRHCGAVPAWTAQFTELKPVRPVVIALFPTSSSTAASD